MTDRPSIARHRRRIVVAASLGGVAALALAVPAFARDGDGPSITVRSASADASTASTDPSSSSSTPATSDVSTPATTDDTTHTTTDDPTHTTTDVSTPATTDDTTHTTFDDHGGDRTERVLAPFTETWTVRGGTVTVSWTGNALRLDAVDPAPGFTVRSESRADELKVRFESDDDRSELEVRIDDGRLRVERDED